MQKCRGKKVLLSAGKSNRCVNPTCPHPGATYYASALLAISLPYSTYGLDVLAFIFPFKPALQAASNAFTGSAPGIVGPLLHLLGLTLVFAALARVAARRLA